MLGVFGIGGSFKPINYADLGAGEANRTLDWLVLRL